VKAQILLPQAHVILSEAGVLADAHRLLLAVDGNIRDTTIRALRASDFDTGLVGWLSVGVTDLAARIDWQRTLD
jgi:ribulose-phosphate 3-epimerase